MWTQDAPPTEALLDARYRLAEVVGEGGMATVYRAEDILLGRTVAVKMIRGGGEEHSSADRAHVEKALLASLNHPSLVSLLDARLDPGRPQYLVMEFVPGPTLSTRMARSTIPPSEIAQIGADVAEGLHVVHAAGIVHRDVKPSNVLLVPPTVEGGRWHAKLADFGIACAVDASRVTTPGFVLGTVSYMAPEQLRNTDPRPALDVYALGLALLEALSGQPGYPPGLGVESALARLHTPPEIPAYLGAEWVEILTRMTALEPASRPPAIEVAKVLAAMAPVASSDGALPVAGTASERGTDATATTGALLAPTRLLPIEQESAPRPHRRTWLGLVGAAAAIVIVAAGAWTLNGTAVPSEVGRTAATAPPRTATSTTPPAGSTQEPSSTVPAAARPDGTAGEKKGRSDGKKGRSDDGAKPDDGASGPGNGSPGRGKGK